MVDQSETLGYKVSPLCAVFGYSRQAYYKWLSKQPVDDFTLRQCLVENALLIRKQRPKCGCRMIYRELGRSWPYGRDKTERMLLSLGFRVQHAKRYVRTTKAGERYFPNLIYGYKVNKINQVWQSDMTYYRTEDGECYFLIFIVDVYSQRIVGHGVFKHYPAEVFVLVLDRAVEQRKGMCLVGLIFHSDRGSQYGSDLFVERINYYKFTSSMAKYSWENPYAEKINDIIKNGYLYPWGPANFKELRVDLNKAVHNYNHFQRIKSLGYASPSEFEEQLRLLPTGQRIELTLKPENKYEYQLVKQQPQQDMNKNL